MRVNQRVTQMESDDFRYGELAVSKTDANGIITYVNEALCRISGYSERELLGRKHSTLSHPDMPSQAYEGVWEALGRGHLWRGMVKEWCKNGDHYWVEASVSPQFDASGRVCGYHATRRKPNRTQIAEATVLYASMCQAERGLGQRGRLSHRETRVPYVGKPILGNHAVGMGML